MKKITQATFEKLTAKQRADLRTGVRKSVVVSAYGALAESVAAGATLAPRNETIRELKRQVRVLRAELKVQAVMWKHVRQGRFEKRAGAPEKHVLVRPSVTETAEKHAQLALLRSRKGKGKTPGEAVGLKSKKPSADGADKRR